MRIYLRPCCHLQRSAAVRLRWETWGGLAFDRSCGDLLELDREGFAVLAALATPQPLLLLRETLRRQGHAVRLPELAAFVKTLEDRGFIRRVPATTPALPLDPWAEENSALPSDRLRAPVVAHWAVTYRCNLQCAFCYSESSPQRDIGPLPQVRRRLVERLADWGVLEVALGGGEPTLLPDFPELLAAIRAAGMVPNVTTNGTVHPPAVLQALAEHAGVVHLSADQPELLDAARGAGVFDRLSDTASRLRAAGVRLGINLLLTPENVKDIRRSLQTALSLGVAGVTFLRPKGPWAATHWPGFPVSRDLETLAVDLRAFLETRPPVRLYIDTALRTEWVQIGLLDDPEPEVLGCGGAQRHVAVTPEGEVYPCSHARQPGYRMGHVLTDDLQRLWLGGPSHEGRQRYLRDCRGRQCTCHP